MKLLILTFLLVIVVFAFLLNNPQDKEQFQATGFSQCVFDPLKVNGGFGTLLACKDYCRNPDNNSSFGGALCNERVCETTCENCRDTQMCRWNTVKPVLTESKVPSKIELEYIIRDNNVLLRWEKPKTETPLNFYSVVVRDSRNNMESEVEINNDINDHFIEHMVTDLKPLRTYYITVFARNNFGYSKESNAVRVQLPYRGPTGYTGFSLPRINTNLLQDYRNQLRQTINRNTQERNSNLDPNRPINPLEILTLYNEQQNEIPSELSVDMNVNMVE